MKKVGMVVASALLLAAHVSVANYPPAPNSDKIQYPPYPGQDYPNTVYFGDTHLHTSYSTDAGLVGCTLSPEDAYRFARGEEIVSSTGVKARIIRPLDFLVVSDHAENLGLSVAIWESNPDLLKNEWGKKIHDIAQRKSEESQIEAYDLWMVSMTALDDPLKKEKGLAETMWHRVTAAAEKYNEPGLFTAFIGYEWTLMPDGNNLHRNVIFRDGKDKADTIIPMSQYDAQDPEKLWDWMEDYEKSTGGKLLAIPHNGNLSNGLMFDDITLTSKQALDREYAKRRMRWEPLYEVTQMKGDGEAHPKLSPADEFADFETWDKGSFGPEKKTAEMLPKEYVRSAYKRGLAYEQKLGINPFKFGLIGSTDSHTALSTAEEDNYFGKVSLLEPSANPIRFAEVVSGRPGPESARMYGRQIASAGLAAVWARENTRESIWDAMARKETFATTGTRIRVRVFGGFGFTEDDLHRSDFARYGYEQGVPMGGDLSKSENSKAPSFLVRALRDPDGANLDRIQMIKGWLDANGEVREKVYDIAVTGDRKIAKDGKCRTPVGSTVNVKKASYTNSIGTAALQTYWQDPDFDPALKAFYYVRVIEIPTPRWTVYDAKIFGVDLPSDVPTEIQERAYTSPIWYTP